MAGEDASGVLPGVLKAATLWPGWFSDQQIAYEQAQHLANALGASVNAGQLAQGWLDANAPPPEKQRRKRKKHQVAVPGAHAVVIPQQQPEPVRRKRRGRPPSPRGYLTQAGVPAAILAALGTVLVSLWAAAWALGWGSAVALVATGSIAQDAEALALLLAEGDHRIGWMLETRLSRLERVLLAALAGNVPADVLADQITAILSSLTSALLVTQTEVTWASGRAAYAVYVAAGIGYKRWQSRNDGRVCGTCLANQAAGAIPMAARFPSGDLHPPAHPRERCALLPAAAPAATGTAAA